MEAQNPLTITLTDALIMQGATTEQGGWNAAQIAVLGVPYPLQTGWKRGLIGTTIPFADYQRYLSLSNRKRQREQPACLSDDAPTISAAALADSLAAWIAENAADIARAVVERAAQLAQADREPEELQSEPAKSRESR